VKPLADDMVAQSEGVSCATPESILSETAHRTPTDKELTEDAKP